MKKSFLKLAEENKNQLIEKLQQAFIDSIDNRGCDYLVELYNDGDVDIWYRPSGSSNFLESNWKGNSVTVAVFNNQYLEIENQEDETEEEWINWYKDEYKYEEAENKLDYFVEQLEHCENER